jgi:hypothetical protein
MLSSETALSIWRVQEEIKKGKELLEKLVSDIENGKETPGGRLPGSTPGTSLQLSVPTRFGVDDSGFRLYMVSPVLGLSIVRSHIAQMEKHLVDLNEAARMELVNAPQV